MCASSLSVLLLVFTPASFARVSLSAYFLFLSPMQLSFYLSLSLSLFCVVSQGRWLRWRLWKKRTTVYGVSWMPTGMRWSFWNRSRVKRSPSAARRTPPASSSSASCSRLCRACRRYHSQSTRHTEQNHFCLVQKVPLTVSTPYSTKSLLSRAEGTTHSQHTIQHKITFVSCRRYHSQSTRHTAQNHFLSRAEGTTHSQHGTQHKITFVSCRRYHSQSTRHTAQNHFLSRAEGTTHSQHGIQHKITFVSCRRYHSQSTRHTEQNHFFSCRRYHSQSTHHTAQNHFLSRAEGTTHSQHGTQHKITFCLVQKVPLTVNTAYSTKSLFVSCRRYHSQSTRHTEQNHFLSRAEGTTHSQHTIQHKITFCLVQKVPLTVSTAHSTKSLFVSCRRYHSQSTRHTEQNHFLSRAEGTTHSQHTQHKITFCLVQKVPLTVSTAHSTKSLFVSCRRYHSQSAHHTEQNHFLSRAEGTTHSQHTIQNKITFCLVQKVPLTVSTAHSTKSLLSRAEGTTHSQHTIQNKITFSRAEGTTYSQHTIQNKITFVSCRRYHSQSTHHTTQNHFLSRAEGTTHIQHTIQHKITFCLVQKVPLTVNTPYSTKSLLSRAEGTTHSQHTIQNKITFVSCRRYHSQSTRHTAQNHFLSRAEGTTHSQHGIQHKITFCLVQKVPLTVNTAYSTKSLLSRAEGTTHSHTPYSTKSLLSRAEGTTHSQHGIQHKITFVSCRRYHSQSTRHTAQNHFLSRAEGTTHSQHAIQNKITFCLVQKVPLTVNTPYRTKSLLSRAEGTTHSQHAIQHKITFVSCRRYHSQSTRHTAQNHFCLVQKVPLTVNTPYSTKSLLSRAEGTTHSQHAIQHKITFCLVQKVPLTVNTAYSTKSLLSRAEGTTHSQHGTQHKITLCLVQKVPLTVNTAYSTKSLLSRAEGTTHSQHAIQHKITFVSCRRYHSQSTRHTAQNHFCLVQKVPLTVNTAYSTKSLFVSFPVKLPTNHSNKGHLFAFIIIII